MAGCCTGRELRLFEGPVKLNVPSGRLDVALYDYVRTCHPKLDLRWLKFVSCLKFDAKTFDYGKCFEEASAKPGDVILLYGVVHMRLSVVAMVTLGRQCKPDDKTIGLCMSDVPLTLCVKQHGQMNKLSLHPTIETLREHMVRTRPSFLCNGCFNTMKSFEEYCDACCKSADKWLRTNVLARDADTAVAVRSYVLALQPEFPQAAVWSSQLSYVNAFSSTGLLKDHHGRVLDGHGLQEISTYMAELLDTWPELVLGSMVASIPSCDTVKRLWGVASRALLMTDAPMVATYCGMFPWHMKTPECTTPPPGAEAFMAAYNKLSRTIGVTLARLVLTMATEQPLAAAPAAKKRRLQQGSLGTFITDEKELSDIEDLMMRNTPPCVKPLLKMNAHMKNDLRFPLASYLTGTHLTGENVRELWKKYAPDQTDFIDAYITKKGVMIPQPERRKCIGCANNYLRKLCPYNQLTDYKSACQAELLTHLDGRMGYVNSPADYFERRVRHQRERANG